MDMETGETGQWSSFSVQSYGLCKRSDRIVLGEQVQATPSQNSRAIVLLM